MSGTKHLKSGGGAAEVKKKKKTKGQTQPPDRRGVPVMVMRNNKLHMEWR